MIVNTEDDGNFFLFTVKKRFVNVGIEYILSKVNWNSLNLVFAKKKKFKSLTQYSFFFDNFTWLLFAKGALKVCLNFLLSQKGYIIQHYNLSSKCQDTFSKDRHFNIKSPPTNLWLSNKKMPFVNNWHKEVPSDKYQRRHFVIFFNFLGNERSLLVYPLSNSSTKIFYHILGGLRIRLGN